MRTTRGASSLETTRPGCRRWSRAFDRMPNDGDDSRHDDQGTISPCAEVSQGGRVWNDGSRLLEQEGTECVRVQPRTTRVSQGGSQSALTRVHGYSCGSLTDVSGSRIRNDQRESKGRLRSEGTEQPGCEAS
eukprot:3092083-Rhodomonas_salina.4